MYAIIETGGKQYRVEKDAVLSVDKLAAEKGGKVTFERVLLAAEEGRLRVGNPTVAGAKVTAEILDQYRADKVIAFKKRRRHGYQRTRGHRQHLTRVKITEIQVG